MTRPTPGVQAESRLLVVGDIVEGIDADRWDAALRTAGWAGPIAVHEHPGRTGDRALLGGNHEPLDPAFALGGTDAIGPDVVVVGIGRSGPAAKLVGLGGRAAAVVVIDGLGGPFVAPQRQIASTLAMVRFALADEASHDPPGPGEVDRRLRHGLVAHGDQRTAAAMVASTPVPLLIIETVDSPVEPSVVDEIVDGASGAPVVLLRLDHPTAERLADSILRWVGSLGGADTTLSS